MNIFSYVVITTLIVVYLIVTLLFLVLVTAVWDDEEIKAKEKREMIGNAIFWPVVVPAMYLWNWIKQQKNQQP